MLGMILAHLCAITLGVYANKILGGSIVGILNILFSAEMVLYFTVQLFSKLNFDDNGDGWIFLFRTCNVFINCNECYLFIL